MRNTQVEIRNDEMHHRGITLADGRYMIFYTFGEQEASAEEFVSTAEREAASPQRTTPSADPVSTK